MLEFYSHIIKIWCNIVFSDRMIIFSTLKTEGGQLLETFFSYYNHQIGHSLIISLDPDIGQSRFSFSEFIEYTYWYMQFCFSNSC